LPSETLPGLKISPNAFAPDPAGEAHSATPDPLAGLGEEMGREKGGEGRERKGWKGKTPN